MFLKIIKSQVFSNKNINSILLKKQVTSYINRLCRTSSSFSLSTDLPEVECFENVDSYKDLYKFSIENSDTFWKTLALSRLKWIKQFTQVSDCDLIQGRINWFADGKLNVSDNCLDRHANENPNKVALIWEKDEPGCSESVTYKELLDLTSKFANCLKKHGVKKGDRVAIYMPVSPIAVAGMLACARIGAVHTVVFAGFSSEALAQRVQDAGVETILTTDQGVRGGNIIELKKTVDEAVKCCPTVKRVFVSKRTGAEVNKTSLDIDLEKELESCDVFCEPEPMNSEDLLFLLYTSGSTGKPKGIVHTQAGYLLYAMMTHKMVFDYQKDDIFGCVADIGWITGHSYVVYGPLANGATSILFESVPTYPDPGRYWEMVERLKINQLYLAPTAIRLLIRFGDSYVKKYDRSSLKTLGSVGEPINHEAWQWYNDVVGENRCDVVDTWWQTETGGITISPRPSEPNGTIYPAACMNPFLGIKIAMLNKDCEEMKDKNSSYACCIAKPWPGMARTIYGDHKRFLDVYLKPYPGYYFSGDGVMLKDEDYYQITGRMDDVMNISGHRVGAAEIEDALTYHPLVSEAAVIGVPHDVKGEVPFAFVTSKQGADICKQNLSKELTLIVRNKIASFAIPHTWIITDSLPKTRSGKIMRRILRKLAVGEITELGDTSTLADPTVIDKLISELKN